MAVRPLVDGRQVVRRVELAVHVLEGAEARDRRAALLLRRPVRDVDGRDVPRGVARPRDRLEPLLVQRHDEIDVVGLLREARVRRADAHEDLVLLDGQVRRRHEAHLRGAVHEFLVVEARLLVVAAAAAELLEHGLALLRLRGEHEGHVPVEAARVLRVLGPLLGQRREAPALAEPHVLVELLEVAVAVADERRLLGLARRRVAGQRVGRRVGLRRVRGQRVDGGAPVHELDVARGCLLHGLLDVREERRLLLHGFDRGLRRDDLARVDEKQLDLVAIQSRIRRPRGESLLKCGWVV
mmetsp:Transcript_20104/g.65110  ORF Transcript_20104/g.65110 Transcript_20104/m.65110 type:complete len:297 (-) Transcript_20104:16-906(-)